MKLRKAQAASDAGMLPEPDRATLARFLERWLEDSAKQKLRPRTLASYRQVIRLHIVPELGRVQIQRLSPIQVQQWLNARQASGLSARTCQYARAILRAALSQALRWGVVTRNAAALVDPPRIVRHEIRPLDPEGARQFLAFSQTHRLGALFTIAVALGLRQGEALGLRWEDVDLDGGRLHVRVALQRVGKEWKLVEPKTERSRRRIALPHVVVTALKAHRVRQLEERMVAGARWREHGLVFTTSVGTPWEPSNLTKEFKKVLRAAKLPDMRFHDLRHTAATLLLAQGVDARTIMETLGHSQISLTLNTYAHVLPELQRDAADRMQRILTR